LELATDQSVDLNLSAVQVLAQDLMSDGPPTDITSRVVTVQRLNGLLVRIPGAVIDTVGTAARSNAKDVSDPGLVLSVRLHTRE